MDILFMVLLVILAALFSAAETSLSGFNRIRLRGYAMQGDRRAARVLRAADNFANTISAILIGNNVVNIALTAIATVAFTRAFGEEIGSILSTVVITFVILTFGEILPKSYAKVNAERTVLSLSAVITVSRALLSPLATFYSKLSEKLFRPSADALPSITEEELGRMIDEIGEEGILQEEEADLVQSALQFSDITVREILTPRVDFDAIDLSSTVDEIKAVLFASRHSRLPAYRGSVDNIVGILLKGEFFAACAMGLPVEPEKMLKPVIYVPATLKIASLLQRLRDDQVHLAIAADERGGTLGLVTLEDILEELVGEIWDESDIAEEDIEFRGEGLYEISGDTECALFFETLGLDEDALDTEALTAGGIVSDLLGKIPEPGDTVAVGGYTVTVTSVEEHRVRRLLAQSAAPEEPAPEVEDLPAAED